MAAAITANEGTYLCRSCAKYEKLIYLEVNKKPSYVKYVVIGVVFGILLISVCIYLIVKIIQKRKALRKAGNYKFIKGELELFNPNLNLNEQAEFLPYNNKFEFPEDDLILGK